MTRIGSSNPQWKGDDVGYRAIHMWVNKWHPRRGECEECGVVGKTDYASLTAPDYVRERSAWRELCRGCHLRLHHSKVTPEQIASLATDTRSTRVIAAEYGVHNSTISRLRRFGRHRKVAA